MEATETQIYQDFLDYIVELYRKDPEKNSKELVNRIETTPDYDEKLREQVSKLPKAILDLVTKE